jgi:hypothetical protein
MDSGWVVPAALGPVVLAAREILLAAALVLVQMVCHHWAELRQAGVVRAVPAAVVLPVVAEVEVVVGDVAAVVVAEAEDAAAEALPIVMFSSATASIAGGASSFKAAFSKPSETRC